MNSKVVNTSYQAFPVEHRQATEAQVASKDPFAGLPPGPNAKKRMAAAAMDMASLPPNIDRRHLSHDASLTVPDTVPVMSPGFTTPTSEPEAVALELPSRYVFYSFKELYVRPFRGVHLAKLSRAREDNSTMQMLEVVSSVLTNGSGQKNLAFQLTMPDFYFVLYWLRMNSFTKALFIHTTQCSNEEHINDVIAGNKPKESLLMSEIINKSSLKTIMLDEIPNMERFALEYPGVTLRPATMLNAVELTEDPRFPDPEFRYAAQHAVYLDLGRSSTLDERIAIFNDMSGDDIEIIKDFEVAFADYGIRETVRVTCKGCGASKVDKVHIDAHSFFPSRQDGRNNGHVRGDTV